MNKNTNNTSVVSMLTLFARLFFVMLVTLVLIPIHTTAQSTDSLTLTVTPPLFQLTIGPGESWASSIKVVNNNPYDVTLYASVMDFASEGENGRGKLTPIIKRDGDETANTLAEWIDVALEPFLVPKETSYEVPFVVHIPANASPGGHYAAVLIGTQPIGGSAGGPTISVSSLISSLFFVRIKGDIIEKGYIQSFLSEHYFYSDQNPEVKFTLQFRNNGNVHLQPKGDIRISTMWGKEVGIIPVNQESHFGNVLPQSSRGYDVVWSGDGGMSDMGRYRATATLTFGDEEHQNVTEDTTFWIVPLRPLLITSGVLILLIIVVALLIRSYVRRSLDATVRRLQK